MGEEATPFGQCKCSAPYEVWGTGTHAIMVHVPFTAPMPASSPPSCFLHPLQYHVLWVGLSPRTCTAYPLTRHVYPDNGSVVCPIVTWGHVDGL